MPCGVSRSYRFLLPETQTKLKLTKIINPPGSWRQPLLASLKMRRIITLLVLASLFLSSCGVFLQNTGLRSYKLKSKIERETLNDYQYDFIYLTKLLETGFPLLDSVFPKNRRDSLKTVILKDLSRKDISKEYFFIQTSKYISNVHNQHTLAYPDKLEFKNKYPFRLFFSQNNWYLLDVSKLQDSSLIGKKILLINNIDIKEIEKKLLQFTFAENIISQQKLIQSLQMFNIPEYLKEIGVIKNLTDTLSLAFDDVSIEIIPTKTKEQNLYNKIIPSFETTKKQNKTYFYNTYPNQNFAYFQFNSCHDKIDILDGIQTYVKPWLQPIAKAFVKRQFKKEKPSSLLAKSYNKENPVFRDFMWKLVDSLNNTNISYLIIDIRNNPGGSSILCKQLLFFLTDKTKINDFTEYAYISDIYKSYFMDTYENIEKENKGVIENGKMVPISQDKNAFSDILDSTSKYHIEVNRPIFKGNVYFLSNYNTGSAAALLITLAQDNGIGTIIGTSVGNNPTGASAWAQFELPKTKTKTVMAISYFKRPDISKGIEQIPDYWIEYSIQDYLTGKDYYFEKALELIKQNKASR